ncbi:MAG: 1-phosphofructokinase [Ruminococcaceae bacterium]|nr:1-phosphofructokinase [Oscillospiraceae bacterium]
MIYTVTLNPSLDYVAFCDTFNFGKTNRTNNEYVVPGGKGLNISILLSRLGDDTCALGFTGGFTGKELTRLLNKEGINCDFQDVAQSTRINIKLSCNKITEFNASGITLDNNKINALKEKLKTLKSGDWLCLSGSIPKGADISIYHDLALCVPQGVKVVIDAVGKPLIEALKVKPFLIKPNIDELCDIFECEIKTQEEIIFYAKKLKDMGAQNVLVSLGEDGALLLDDTGKIHTTKPPKGKAVNTVAAGDSMIAGFIHQFIKTNDYADSLKFATASGSATAFSPWIAKPELIEQLYKTL